jgi:phosphoribosyl-ATP pyrophosphohydrolase
MMFSEDDREYVNENYAPLIDVFSRSLAQAGLGKGMRRHGHTHARWIEQPMFTIRDHVGSGFPLGQAIKKIIEAQHLDHGKAIDELLGAINYVASEIVALAKEADENGDPYDDDYSLHPLFLQVGSNYSRVFSWMSIADQFPITVLAEKEDVLKTLRLRASLVNEEQKEVQEALQAAIEAVETQPRNEIPRVLLEPLVKEACDLLYVTYGLLCSLGVDADKVFDRVHQSNMSKLSFDFMGRLLRDDMGKIMKGPNYIPPVLEDVL